MSGIHSKVLFTGLLLATITAKPVVDWPLRYNGPIDGIDQVTAMAVDKHGNIYVTGKSQGSGTDWDFATTSYDADGNVRSGWPKRYDGPASGVDIATAIHVDADDNVYVAGTSEGESSGFDFCVIKYDSGGDEVWPPSGSDDGVVFDGGAARTTHTNHEGTVDNGDTVYVSMAVKESFVASERIIALTGPSEQQGSPPQNAGWHTVVLEPSIGAGGSQVQVKEGWPVQWPNENVQDDIPRGIAINSDNTVFVTGDTWLTVEDHWMTTVRFKAAGKDGGSDSNAKLWRDDYGGQSEGDQEEGGANIGRAIVLDKDGNAYVTGEVSENPGDAGKFDYATIAYTRDGSSGNGVVLENSPSTGVFYDADGSAGDDKPSSISLTFEVEGGVLKPFVHVTGFSEGSGTGKDIATISYRGDNGQERYENPIRHNRANYADEGMMVIGAGKGNVYVVGRTKSGQSAEFEFTQLVYRLDGSSRLDPQYIDDGSGQDEAHVGVMGGAGLLYSGGLSLDSGPGVDYLTHFRFQEPAGCSLDAYYKDIGGTVSGGLSELTNSDNSYMDVPAIVPFGQSAIYQVEVRFDVTVSEVATELNLKFESHITASSAIEKIQLYDRLTASYVTISEHAAATAANSTTIIPIKDDPERFVDPTTGLVKVRVKFTGGSTAFTAKMDQLVLQTVGI